MTCCHLIFDPAILFQMLLVEFCDFDVNAKAVIALIFCWLSQVCQILCKCYECCNYLNNWVGCFNRNGRTSSI